MSDTAPSPDEYETEAALLGERIASFKEKRRSIDENREWLKDEWKWFEEERESLKEERKAFKKERETLTEEWQSLETEQRSGRDERQLLGCWVVVSYWNSDSCSLVQEAARGDSIRQR